MNEKMSYEKAKEILKDMKASMTGIAVNPDWKEATDVLSDALDRCMDMDSTQNGQRLVAVFPDAIFESDDDNECVHAQIEYFNIDLPYKWWDSTQPYKDDPNALNNREEYERLCGFIPVRKVKEIIDQLPYKTKPDYNGSTTPGVLYPERQYIDLSKNELMKRFDIDINEKKKKTDLFWDTLSKLVKYHGANTITSALNLMKENRYDYDQHSPFNDVIEKLVYYYGIDKIEEGLTLMEKNGSIRRLTLSMDDAYDEI